MLYGGAIKGGNDAVGLMFGYMKARLSMIEIVRPRSAAYPRAVLFDFDGTLSLIRSGWQSIMRELMLQILLATRPADAIETIAARVAAARARAASRVAKLPPPRRPRSNAELDGTLLEELAAPRLVLGGFSQGATLACDVALRAGLPLAGLALLSATVIAEEEWTALAASRRGLKVFQAHGRQDELLPFAVAERLRRLLETGGAAVRSVSFSGGHGIPGPVVAELGGFLRDVLIGALLRLRGQCRLVVLRGARGGREHIFTGDVIRAGRAAENDLVCEPTSR